MSVPVHCPYCGLGFTSRVFHIENSSDITLQGNRETCPRCGQLANIQDGTYDFVGNVISAIRAPGVMRADVLALQNIAKSVQSGELSAEDAESEIAKINAAFVVIWRWTNANAGAITVLLAIIALWVAVYAAHAADMSSEQQHSDEVHQTQVIESNGQFQQKIYEELAKQGVLAKSQATRLPPIGAKPLPYQPHRQVQGKPVNRAERRALKSQRRRQGKNGPSEPH